MAAKEFEILDFLSQIKAGGTFVASGTADFILPGLSIQEFGELALPLTALQAENLIKIAHKAPFGKGSKTIVDEKVRSAWEIDASQLTFHNPLWDGWLTNILNNIKGQMGLEDQNIRASLYKMLIYEKGDFFTWHKDSEKEKNMFATLVLTLPSSIYIGGELVVRFKDEEIVIDYSLLSSYGFNYAAFYADCDHEVRELISGYRVSLVYNLLQSPVSTKLSADAFSQQTNQLATMLEEWKPSFGGDIKTFLLDHQYTPSNFSFNSLKLADKARYQALSSAAKKAGFYSNLVLVTHYQMGELEEVSYSRRSRYRSYDDDYNNENVDGKMGEIYEESTAIEYWAGEELPSFGQLSLNSQELITNKDFTKDEPIEKEAEGYTGNEGMTMEYWYHHGAIVIWTEAVHEEMLARLPLSERLTWLAYYSHHFKKEPKAKHFLQILLSNVSHSSTEKGWEYDEIDASGLADTWVLFKDDSAFEAGSEKLVSLFHKISFTSWATLIQTYPSHLIQPIFEQVCQKQNSIFTDYLLRLLIYLQEKEVTPTFVAEEIDRLPSLLANISLYLFPTQNIYYYNIKERNDLARSIFTHLLILSNSTTKNPKWSESIAEALLLASNVDYINTILVNVILKKTEYKDNPLYQSIYQFCVKDLEARTAQKPQPLPNWTREVPKSDYYQSVWLMLTPFLQSPTDTIFEFRRAERERNTVESAIRNVTIDLEYTTIRKGSPHTLQIKKNNAAYVKELDKWEIDCDLLANLKEL